MPAAILFGLPSFDEPTSGQSIQLIELSHDRYFFYIRARNTIATANFPFFAAAFFSHPPTTTTTSPLSRANHIRRCKQENITKNGS